jgi:phosphate-selective porin OprO and OprP
MSADMKNYNSLGLVPTQRAAAIAAVFFFSCTALAAPAGAADNASGTTNAIDAPSATGDATGSDIDSVRRQLKQEEERIHALEQWLAADEAARAAAGQSSASPASAPPAPGTAAPVSPQYAAPAGASALAANFGSSGFVLQSPDGANVIRFRGNLSVDGRYYSDDYTPESADTWLIRKLRPTLEGTLWHYFDFRFMPDFGQGKTILQDAWADARAKPWLVFQFGKFKAPVGLERLQLEQFARFIEASLTSDLLPYRDIGFKIGGNVAGGIVNYDVGIFDGAVDGTSTDSNSVPDANSTGHFTFDGRLFFAPFLREGPSGLKKLGFGVAETNASNTGIATATTTTSLLAGYKTPGQQPMFNYRADTLISPALYSNATIAHGTERRVVPQLYYYNRFLGLMSEYVHEDLQVKRQLTTTSARAGELQNTAWQVQGYWFITGEDEAYDSATPRCNFGPGCVGAFELVARYSAINFDPQSFTDKSSSFASPTAAPQAARAIGTGINWYLNPNFKVQLDYEVTQYTGGAARGLKTIDRPDERVLISQFALIF